MRETPTRAEFDRLIRDVQKLTERQGDVDRELAIQFRRIADLQAEIDLLQAAKPIPRRPRQSRKK